jgi:hypothetical protein
MKEQSKSLSRRLKRCWSARTIDAQEDARLGADQQMKFCLWNQKTPGAFVQDRSETTP